MILLYITTWKYQLFCIDISLVLRIKTRNLAVSFVAYFRGNSRNGIVYRSNSDFNKTIYRDLSKGAKRIKWFLKGVKSSSLRIQLAPLGRCWYMTVLKWCLFQSWIPLPSIFKSCRVYLFFWWEISITRLPSLKLTVRSENRPSQKESSLPTIKNEVRTVSFRDVEVLQESSPMSSRNSL